MGVAVICVDQTIFGAPQGNCLAACVASLLGCSLADVCDFSEKGWLDELTAWLAPRGLYAVCFKTETDWRPPGLYILGGKSPRGDFLHAVIARGTTVVHDPHPSREGVLSHVDGTIFVPLDPSRGYA